MLMPGEVAPFQPGQIVHSNDSLREPSAEFNSSADVDGEVINVPSESNAQDPAPPSPLFIPNHSPNNFPNPGSPIYHPRPSPIDDPYDLYAAEADEEADEDEWMPLNGSQGNPYRILSETADNFPNTPTKYGPEVCSVIRASSVEFVMGHISNTFNQIIHTNQSRNRAFHENPNRLPFTDQTFRTIPMTAVKRIVMGMLRQMAEQESIRAEVNRI
ncbi:hypothetical protein PTTG_26569 [Puccinia triticina 1-1 BBBD Race 1]|uniref:Uncharacterized protein n=1 Tax=Puccinia triticina (isolate 1-1 / race 1 (BBBD)) TaxID=630390 RepID=A0A180GTN5_PUCT1|nr:hypothetical protein PTTG_26569 [Puccinia triticina 1-1 BBBD Race 1]